MRIIFFPPFIFFFFLFIFCLSSFILFSQEKNTASNKKNKSQESTKEIKVDKKAQANSEIKLESKPTSESKINQNEKVDNKVSNEKSKKDTLKKNNSKQKNKDKKKNDISIDFLDLDYFTNQSFFQKDLEKKIKKYNRAQDYYQMGVLFLLKKNTKEAKKYFTQGKKNLVEKIHLHRYIYAIGYCQYVEKDYTKAEKSMHEVIKLERYLKAFKILTLLYFNQKKYALAKKYLKQIKNYPDFKTESKWAELEKEIEEFLAEEEVEKDE